MKRNRILSALMSLLLIVPLGAWPSCNGSQQQKAMRGVNSIYDAAIGAGILLKGYHSSGQLNDDGYRSGLKALGDVRQVMREFTEVVAGMPAVDEANKQLVGVFISRTGDALKRLAQVGALHLPADKAREFTLAVSVGVEAALTIYDFVLTIKKPTTLSTLPERSSQGVDIGAWLVEVN